MDEILWVFMVLDPWRMLLPVGLSMVLAGTRWLEKVRHRPPNVVFHETLASLSIRSALWLFGLTGFVGLIYSWFAGGQANAGGLGYLEALIFLSGVCGNTIEGESFGSPNRRFCFMAPACCFWRRPLCGFSNEISW